MIKKFDRLDERIRFGALGNLYGMGIYFVTSVVITLLNIPNNLHNTEDKLGLVYRPVYYEIALFKYAVLIVLILSIYLTIWTKRKSELLLLLGYLIPNILFATILLPGALIILGILSSLIGLLLGFTLTYLLLFTGYYY